MNSNITERILSYINSRLENYQRKPSRKEKQMSLLEVTMDGVPMVRVMHGNGVEQTYFPTSTYSRSLNWHVITPNYPRPYAPREIWDTLEEMLKSVYDLKWDETVPHGHGSVPIYTRVVNDSPLAQPT